MKATILSMVAAASLAVMGTAFAAQPDGRGTAPLGVQNQSSGLNLAIKYHGGPVLNDPNGANVYYIWYGDWSGDTATTILTNMMKHVSGSRWNAINTTYYGISGGVKTYVPNKINYVAATTDNYTYGTALSDSQIAQVVADAITSGRLPKDSNALYFVLTSKDVTATSGFCSQYCGWHNHASLGGTDIKYSFVGNATTQCPTGCAAPEIQASSPNGNLGADGMASVIMHELVETVSDPDLNAWSDLIGQENADKCAWTFGTEGSAPNGAAYNTRFGTGYYLIQRNWSATSQKCLQRL
jgi:flagellar hook protein FlgE